MRQGVTNKFRPVVGLTTEPLSPSETTDTGSGQRRGHAREVRSRETGNEQQARARIRVRGRGSQARGSITREWSRTHRKGRQGTDKEEEREEEGQEGG